VSTRKKILVAIGTRPEAIKLAPVVRALEESPLLDVRIVATAQHRDLLDQILRFFDLHADVDLNLMRPRQGLADLTSRMITAFDAALAAETPDLVLGQGDTTTVFVTALCCFYRDVRFGHVEAGLRTTDPRSPFPEEMNRRMVGRLADLHFAPTERAAQALRAEGVPEPRLHVTGNTVIDALVWTAERVDATRFAPARGRRLVLVTAHRRENFGEPFARICAAIRTLAERPDVEILYPVHPNPNVRETVGRLLADHPAIRLTDPLDYPDFVAAMKAADLILTDSGGVQEEAPTLGVPVLVMREDTERPEGIAAGSARLVGTATGSIVAAARELLDDPAAHARMARGANPYGDGRAARRIAGVVHDYLAARDRA
jgi:UDP-N-acetylglucosamine 2-epimerase (non-hydrolysing)